MGLSVLEGTIGHQGAEDHAGDRASHLVLFDDGGDGDVLAELGDAGEDAVIGGPVDEDGMFGFFLCLSLGPFLRKGRDTLWPPFAWEAALAIWSLDFLVPAGALACVITQLPLA